MKASTIYLIVYCALIVGFSLLFNWGIMALWNWLMPLLFNLPKLTFWQMYGFTVLLSFLASLLRKPQKKG